MGSIGSSHHDPQLAASASSNEAADMITLDCSKLHGSAAERGEALRQLDHALQTYGFIYLANHGMPAEVYDHALEWITRPNPKKLTNRLHSKRFFALDAATKNLIPRPASDALEDHLGYAEYGVGHISQLVFDEAAVEAHRRASPDHKETLEVGNPADPKNRWLPESVLPGFRAFYARFWAACNEVEAALRRALCDILAIEPDRLCRMQSQRFGHISFLHYPQMVLQSAAATTAAGQAPRRLNAHTDYGGLTLVFQDHVGGLEVHDGAVFRPVAPKPGTIVVNVGDMLERQSNGRWKSALHQVVGPREETLGLGEPAAAAAAARSDAGKLVFDRYSIAYTGAVDPEVMIETLPGCDVPGKWRPSMADWDQEKPVTSYEWLTKRVAAEYHQG
ncbi:Clavaminate synthase-like protein [Aspergillus brunneoviolaceus CBS 621.78]|uniref:Clavaminate synthase-like protein n=1 Tax=Aspergillus brunneoviolaceus CBS 621.78 TaxID=1450534 RepID=A0ACD1G3G1_9EURO|nr:Clavaminate synthase-like protein [Aspergillus brunneoviolaceus CBS 621.78]RAH43811.1 Clavaminate synthase-like protein [Aspergillus brunneoviolaceus CBS 621.78]